MVSGKTKNAFVSKLQRISRPASLRKVAAKTGVSARTVGRVVKLAGLKPYCPHEYPAITRQQGRTRVAFARKQMKDYRSQTLFTDVTTFTLNGHTNRKNDVRWAISAAAVRKRP